MITQRSFEHPVIRKNSAIFLLKQKLEKQAIALSTALYMFFAIKQKKMFIFEDIRVRSY